MFAGAEKFTIMDPVTEDRIQINSVSAQHTEFNNDWIRDEETNMHAYGGDTIELIIGARNLTDEMIALLEEWAEEETLLNVYGWGLDFVLSWEKSKKIGLHKVDNTNSSGGKSVYRIRFYHEGYTRQIQWGRNLMHLIAPWREENVVGQDALWTPFFLTPVWQGQTDLRLDGPASGPRGGIFIELNFPISNAIIVGSLRRVSGGPTQLSLTAIAASTVQNTSETAIDGIVSVKMTTPAGMRIIRVNISVNNNETTFFRQPALRPDSTKYVEE